MYVPILDIKDVTKPCLTQNGPQACVFKTWSAVKKAKNLLVTNP